MTLAFRTHWGKDMPEHMAGKPTRFIQKIYQCLLRDNVEMDSFEFNDKLKEVMPMIGDTIVGDYPQKKHTIRRDSKNRWQAAKLIHPVINNRTPKRFQFAPTLFCVSVQDISISYDEKLCEHSGTEPTISIDGRVLSIDEIEQLAINDGFENSRDFCYWFKEDLEGKIIHWTDLKY